MIFRNKNKRHKYAIIFLTVSIAALNILVGPGSFTFAAEANKEAVMSVKDLTREELEQKVIQPADDDHIQELKAENDEESEAENEQATGAENEQSSAVGSESSDSPNDKNNGEGGVADFDAKDEKANTQISRAPGEGVVSMNDVLYESLQDAVDASPAQSTIIILDDLVLSSSVNIPEGKSITLTDDGNSHTIASEEGKNLAPLFSVQRGGELTFAATSDDKMILLGSSVTGNRCTLIHCKGKLNLQAATLEGGSVNGYQTSSVLIDTGSSFNMTGGIIENLTGQMSYGAAVVVNSGAKFEMSGGSIRNNTNNSTSTYAAGGVLMNNWSGAKNQFNMSGGSISGNSGTNGGGVMLVGATDFHLTGGEISNNKAVQQGGGVCVTGTDMTNNCYDTCSFVMDGGSVSGNTARNGGGIYVNSDAVHLNAGRIENNVARATSYNQWSGHGGGVYVSEVPRILYVSDAIITDNTATAVLGIGGTSGMGGGLWACPTGSIELNVTNGVAVYDNHAVGRDSAGDDVVNVHNSSGVHGTLTLSDRMLGGGAVKWYEDGAVADSIVGYVDGSVPRFDPDNPGEELHFNNDPTRIALKAVTTEAAIKRAQEEAKLFVQGNRANHGGGIGTNGKLSLSNYGTPDWTLSVTKEWKEIEQEEQQPIHVFLKIEGTILDPVTLDGSNEWTASFTQLPDPASLQNGDISVVEGYYSMDPDGTQTFVEADSYQVDYEKAVNEENHLITITVVNSPKPEVMIDVIGQKIWDDNNNHDGFRPDRITIRLLADGTEKESRIVTSENSWTWKFKNLPKYDRTDGHEIVYKIKEDEIACYTASYNDYDVTNTYTPDKTSISVTKLWDDEDDKDGIRPSKVTIKLLADGKNSGELIVLNKSNDWTGSFTDMDKYKNGKLIIYSVEEADVYGYTGQISGDQESGFTVINKHTPKNNSGDDKCKNDTNKSGSPKTGDDTRIALYAGIILIATVILIIIVVSRRRRK